MPAPGNNAIFFVKCNQVVFVRAVSRVQRGSRQKVRIMPRHPLPALLAVVAVAHTESWRACQRTTAFPTAWCGRQRERRSVRFLVHLHILGLLMRDTKSRELRLRKRGRRVGNVFVFRDRRRHAAAAVVWPLLSVLADCEAWEWWERIARHAAC